MKAAIAAVGYMVTLLLGGWDNLVQVFFVFLILDYATGCAEAYVNGTLSSKVGAKGIVKKLGFIVLVIVAQQADLLINTPSGVVLRNLVLWALVSNEGLSILENLGGMGLPIPPFLRNAISSLNLTPPAVTPPADKPVRPPDPPKQGGIGI